MGFSVKGNIVDVVGRRVYKAQIFVEERSVVRIIECDDVGDVFIMPGFVDSHVHIESSMLVPQEFARLAVQHGTVASVSDPHEIANVLGVQGVDFMIENGNKVPFKFNFGVPSCVPATGFETSGSVLNSVDVEKLLQRDELKYLSEMMNFPGVVFGDDEVMKKIAASKKVYKPIDGHAPGLSGEELKIYARAGITTDHESVSVEEAVEKIKTGIKLQIREGSAAKNFDILWPVIDMYPDDVMLCTDDCHPDDLIEKHINDVVKRAIKNGAKLFNVLRTVSYNPIKHYNLNVGLLQEGDPADFIIVNDLTNFDVLHTYINGEKVYSNNSVLFKVFPFKSLNNFNISFITKDDIKLVSKGATQKIMLAKDGDLYTAMEYVKFAEKGSVITSNVNKDILKIVVVNRYKKSEPVVGLIKNFGLKHGAIAGSVAHDSHNIIAVGVSDEDIYKAINLVIKEQGGMVAKSGKQEYILPLRVAGLMSDKPGEEVAQ
ncbi:MAG: adenine deaminase, partial [Bacteroidetes bacterium]